MAHCLRPCKTNLAKLWHPKCRLYSSQFEDTDHDIAPVAKSSSYTQSRVEEWSTQLNGLVGEAARLLPVGTVTNRKQLTSHVVQQASALHTRISQLATITYSFHDTASSQENLQQLEYARHVLLPKYTDTLLSQFIDGQFRQPAVHTYSYSEDEMCPSTCRSEQPFCLAPGKLPLDGQFLDKFFGVDKSEGAQVDCLMNVSHNEHCGNQNVDTIVQLKDNNEVLNNKTESMKYHVTGCIKSVKDVSCDSTRKYESRVETSASHESENNFVDFPAFHSASEYAPHFTDNPALSEASVAFFAKSKFDPSSRKSEFVSARPNGGGVSSFNLSSSHAVYMADGKPETGLPSGGNNRQPRPTLDQLMRLQDHMAENLPKVLTHVKAHDYRIYHQDIEFENNYSTPYVSRGISAYVFEVVKLRLWAHFKFANVKVHLLKLTSHEEEGCVRVRWRLSGIPQARAFMFWKFMPWLYKKNVNNQSEWYDGISTFYVDGTGLVYKHRIDRVIAEEERELAKEPSLKTKIEAILTPKPALGSTASQ